MPHALFELPPVGVRLPGVDAVQLGLRLLQLLSSALGVDLAGVDRVVDEREGAVLLDLEEARAGGELEDVAFGDVDAGGPRLQHCDEWRVAPEQPDLARGAGPA